MSIRRAFQRLDKAPANALWAENRNLIHADTHDRRADSLSVGVNGVCVLSWLAWPASVSSNLRSASIVWAIYCTQENRFQRHTHILYTHTLWRCKLLLLNSLSSPIALSGIYAVVVLLCHYGILWQILAECNLSSGGLWTWDNIKALFRRLFGRWSLKYITKMTT